MKVRRDIASIPLRSAVDTWVEYKKLVSGTGSVDAGQFDAATSVMTSLITDEAFKDEPLTLTGVSHELFANLVYTSRSGSGPAWRVSVPISLALSHFDPVAELHPADHFCEPLEPA